MRKAAAWLLAVVAVVSGAITSTGTASAHAALERSEPAQGAVLPASPPRVLLEFSEPVELGLADISLVGQQGVVVSSPVLTPVGQLGVEFPVPPLPDGSYAVIIRVVSAVDGHATAASVSFAVGEPTGAIQIGDTGAGGPPRVALAASKLVTFLGVTALWTFITFAALALRAAEQRWVTPRYALAVGTLLLIGTFTALAIQCWTAAGSIADVRASTLRAVFDTRFGHIWWFRLSAAVMATALLVAAPRVRRGWTGVAPLAICAFGITLSISLNSHLAAHEGAGALPELADWLHFMAATAWIGGVTALAIRTRRPGTAIAAEMERFTLVALPAVVILATSGVLAWLWLSSSWSDLWDSGYGRLVVVKATLFAPMLVLGGAHLLGGRRRTAPGLRFLGRPAKTLLAEALFGVSVLVAAAFLSSTPPPGEALATARPRALTIQAANGSVSGKLTVDPGRAGNNTFSIEITGSEVASLAFRISLPSSGIEPLTAAVQPDPKGGFSTGPVLLPLTGVWEAVVTVTPRSGVEREIRFSLPIGQ